jgi:hypothetical protein
MTSLSKLVERVCWSCGSSRKVCQVGRGGSSRPNERVRQICESNGSGGSGDSFDPCDSDDSGGLPGSRGSGVSGGKGGKERSGSLGGSSGMVCKSIGRRGRTIRWGR